MLWDYILLYPGVPHEGGLQALEKTRNNRTNKSVSTEKLKMANFVLKNN